jgi:hypothetical protein
MDEAKTLGIVTEVWGEAELKTRSFNDAVMDYARQFTRPTRRAARWAG